MADQKITQLPTLATPTGDDLLVVVDDVAGTPVTKSVRVDALLAVGGGGGGGVVTGAYDYIFNATTAAPPASGNVRVDAAAPYTAVSTVWLHRQDRNGNDSRTPLLLHQAGDVLQLEDKDNADVYVRFTLTAAPVDSGTYVTLAVTHVQGAGTLPTGHISAYFGSAGGGTVDVLWVGPEAPTAPAIELWADTDAVAAGGGGGNAFGDVPLDQSTWSWVNQGAATVTQGNGVVLLLGPSTASINYRVRETVMPTPPFTVTARLIFDFVTTGAHHGGICLRESATGKFAVLKSVISGYSWTRHPNGVASNSGAVDVTPQRTQLQRSHVWFRLRVASGMVTASYSLDGVNFRQQASEAVTASFTTAPDRIGFAVNCESAVGEVGMSVMSWVQTA